MIHLFRRFSILVCCSLALTGCVSKGGTLSQELRMTLFREGKAVLDCDMACSWTWITNRRDLANLYWTEQWDALAQRIIEIGYQEDLGYFWLGVAAEESGYPAAAYRYYRVTLAMQSISYANAHCMSRIDGCFRIPIFQIAAQRIAALEAAARRPPPPPIAPSPQPVPPPRQAQPQPRTAPAPTVRPSSPPVLQPPSPPSSAAPSKSSPSLPLDDEIVPPPIRR